MRTAIVVLAFAAAGCGDGTATVTGTVTHRGRPVPFGAVTVRHADGKTARTGVIRPDGTYAVERVARGPATVGVASPDPAKARVPGERPAPRAKGPTPGWVPLPASYADPATSGLRCDVNASRVHFDIDIP